MGTFLTSWVFWVVVAAIVAIIAVIVLIIDAMKNKKNKKEVNNESVNNASIPEAPLVEEPVTVEQGSIIDENEPLNTPVFNDINVVKPTAVIPPEVTNVSEVSMSDALKSTAVITPEVPGVDKSETDIFSEPISVNTPSMVEENLTAEVLEPASPTSFIDEGWDKLPETLEEVKVETLDDGLQSTDLNNDDLNKSVQAPSDNMDIWK